MMYKKHNLKPIFKEEMIFLNSHLDNLIHENSWRHGQSIYSNPYTTSPYMQFAVKDGDIALKNYRKERVDKSFTFRDIINKEIERLSMLEKNSIDFLKNYHDSNKEIRHIASYSGGKDSDVLKLIF